jgi:hypothetical protein
MINSISGRSVISSLASNEIALADSFRSHRCVSGETRKVLPAYPITFSNNGTSVGLRLKARICASSLASSNPIEETTVLKAFSPKSFQRRAGRALDAGVADSAATTPSGSVNFETVKVTEAASAELMI